MGVKLTLNWHLMPKCNYRCLFCFQTFHGKQKWIKNIDISSKILKKIADSGIYKITFSGGEPFLHPNIDLIINESKRLGLVTSAVTNGVLLNSERLKRLAGDLDILAVSVDSAVERTETLMGRGNGGHISHAKEVARLAKENGIRLKINTVVTRYNVKESMTELIEELHPERWKIFQYLPIDGEAGLNDSNMKISTTEFNSFVAQNQLKTNIKIVAERNEDMLGSYIMLDPEGYVIRNIDGRYERMANILLDKIENALSVSGFDVRKFLGRDGDYF